MYIAALVFEFYNSILTNKIYVHIMKCKLPKNLDKFIFIQLQI